MPRWNLRPLLAPRSVAVVGASESPDSWAPEIERSLRHLGFDGELFPVNPKYDRVWDRPCLSSVRDLPKGVDLVVFVVPARVVVRMIDDCGARGVRGIMVVSSGFAEAGEEGRALQAELRDAALRNRIPLLGPNVEGFVNYLDHVAPYGTTPPPHPVAGPISVISQSGTVAWAMNQMASDRGVGMRIILGVGNEAVLGLGISTVGRQQIAAPAWSRATSRRCAMSGRSAPAWMPFASAGKPVLICAPEGRSEAARRSIVAHTGALAGNTALRDAWLRGRGAVLVEDPVTMFEAAVLFSHAKKLRSTGVAAALQSGGACTLFAEAAGAAGLSLPEFAPVTKRSLKKALPSFASQNNPLDVTGQAAVETAHVRGCVGRRSRHDPAVGLVAFDAFPPRLPGETPWADPVLAKVVELQRATGVVFASVAMGPLGVCTGGDRVHEAMEAVGVPAGSSRIGGSDPSTRRPPGREGAGVRPAGAPRGEDGRAAGVAGAEGCRRRSDRCCGAGSLRRASSEGGDGDHASGRGTTQRNASGSPSRSRRWRPRSRTRRASAGFASV